VAIQPSLLPRSLCSPKANSKEGSRVLVAHACNPSYFRGWDQEDWGSRPARANSSWDPSPK
jgi:hypothetical protein